MSFDFIKTCEGHTYRANLSVAPVHYYDGAPPEVIKLAVEAFNPRLLERIAFFDEAIATNNPKFPWGHQPAFLQEGESVESCLMRQVQEYRQKAFNQLKTAYKAWMDGGSVMPDIQISGITLKEIIR